ncbi:MAG: hypothetical protein HKN35_15880 [Woeseia sp.]|nr:hypothetical protein [Woeseia sp.]
MDIKTIKAELWEIAKVYPTLMGLLQKTLDNGKGETIGNVWARTVQNSHLDSDHFSNVCYEYQCLERPMPNPLDTLVFEIVEEAKERADRDRRKLEQHSKYHGRKRSKASPLYYRAAHWVIDHGPLEPDRLDELCNWVNKDAQRPAWLAEGEL